MHRREEDAQDEEAGKELRKACGEQPQSIDRIRSLVEKCPNAIKTVDEYGAGNLPLHEACRNEAPPEVIQYLVDQWAESVKTFNSYQQLPLHRACQNRASLEVVRYLVEQWPDSVRAADGYSDLPVHLACMSGSRLEVVQYLVEQWPDSVKAEDDDGNTPRDLAKCFAGVAEVVAWLESVM